MATLPDTFARRPTPRFGRVDQANPVVTDPDVPVGRSIQRLGLTVMEVFHRKQIEEDKYQVEDRTTKLKQASLDLAKGENGYLGVLGANVGPEFHEDRMAQFDDARTTIAEGLTPGQMQAFSARAELARINYQEGLINHIAKQQDVKNTQAYVAGVSTEQDNAMLNPDNPSEIYQSIDRIKHLTETEAARKGVTGDAKDFLIKENISGAHAGVIQALVDDGNYTGAREWYVEHGDQIMGETQSRIEKLLDAAGKEDRSQALVDGMWDEFKDDPAAGRKYIRDQAKPEDRDESLRRYNNRLAEDKVAERDGWDANGESARDTYASLIDAGSSPQAAYDAIPMSVREAMKPSERMALQTRVDAASTGSTAVKTDIKTYLKLAALAEEDPVEFSKIDLGMYDQVISIGDLKTLQGKKATDTKVLRTDTQVINDGLLAVGMDPKDLTKDGGSGDEAREFRMRIENDLALLKDYNRDDVVEVVDRHTIEVLRERSVNPWGDRPFRLLGDFTEFAGDMEIEGIPSELIDDLAADLRDRNVPVTEEAIRNLYIEMSSGG